MAGKTNTGTLLAGRTAIVTGSGRNVGKGIALAFAAEGANIVVNGHSNRAAIEAVAAEARARGAGALGVVADVGDPEAVQRMVDAAISEFGAVDIAVSNVAIRPRQALLDISLADWEHVLRTDLTSAFLLARAVLPGMRARQWGRIIHISGRDGFVGLPFRAHCVAAKAGVFGLAKAIANEFGPDGITANTVSPGIIETTRDPVDFPDYERAFEERRLRIPVRRLGTLADVAAACLFLASEASGYVTGQVLHVNGGEFIA